MAALIHFQYDLTLVNVEVTKKKLLADNLWLPLAISTIES